MQTSSYPHAFLDTNALARLYCSITSHRLLPDGRYSRLRVLLSRGVIKLSTGEPQHRRSLELILNSTLRSCGSGLDPKIASLNVLLEIITAVKEGWLVIIYEWIAGALSPPHRALYSSLATSWSERVVDPEDKEVLKYAAIAYARYSFYRVRARGSEYLMASPMIIVSDDTDIIRAEAELNSDLWKSLDQVRREGYIIKSPNVERLIYVISFNDFRKLVMKITQF